MKIEWIERVYSLESNKQLSIPDWDQILISKIKENFKLKTQRYSGNLKRRNGGLRLHVRPSSCAQTSVKEGNRIPGRGQMRETCGERGGERGERAEGEES